MGNEEKDVPPIDAGLPEITPEAVAAGAALSGRVVAPEHLPLMAELLPESRRRLMALRASALKEGEAPALHFAPTSGRSPGPERGPRRTPIVHTPGVRWNRRPMPRWNGSEEALAFLPAADLARLLRAGRVTSRTLTEMYLARLKRYGPDLNCVVSLVPDGVALAAADRADREIAAGEWRGPLHGLPYGAKDLFATRGLPTTWGVEPYRERVIDADATVIGRLEDAGAVLVSKLSLGELAMGDVWFGGLTRNPWKREDGSSGSSAGSGSAVAAGLVAFALGTETWGSIVSPCVVCGTTGLRPTFGRVPRTGAMALAWSMDKVGPMARGVEDCALVFDAVAGPDGIDATVGEHGPPFRWSTRGDLSGLRVGIDVASFEALRADKKRSADVPAYDEAVAALERLLGRSLLPVQLPEMRPEYEALPMTIIGVEGAASMEPLIASGEMDRLAQQERHSWPNTFRLAATVPATEYLQAQRLRAHLQREFADAVRAVDVYVTVPRCGHSLLYTNLTGHPEVVTRCGKTEEGLPLSLSLVGALHREDAALSLAHAFERATPWHREWPQGYGG